MKYYMKMDFKEIACDDVDGIYLLAQDRVH
jgi:hypothetical protein